MSLINTAIGPRAYEVIRDRIAAVLALELTAQAALHINEQIAARVYVQRSEPVSHTECPVVLVSLSKGRFEQQTAIDSDGVFEFYIDTYCTGDYSETTRGDTKASLLSQRIGGVVQGILEHPAYLTLGFEPPFIAHTEIESFELGPAERNESTSLVVFRNIFSVTASQGEQFQTAPVIAEMLTQVMLSNNNHGYFYETQF